MPKKELSAEKQFALWLGKAGSLEQSLNNIYPLSDLHHSAYGSEVGSSSIKFLPTGGNVPFLNPGFHLETSESLTLLLLIPHLHIGMFVTGGVTPKNIHFIEGENSCFMTAYKDKGRVTPLLEKIPLFAVMTEDLGVRGALKAALMVSCEWQSLLFYYEFTLRSCFSFPSRFARNMKSCMQLKRRTVQTEKRRRSPTIQHTGRSLWSLPLSLPWLPERLSQVEL